MNGMLSNAPYWVDSANNEVSSVQFTFENAIAGNPNTNVDSDTVTIRIISEDEAGKFRYYSYKTKRLYNRWGISLKIIIFS